MPKKEGHETENYFELEESPQDLVHKIGQPTPYRYELLPTMTL